MYTSRRKAQASASLEQAIQSPHYSDTSFVPILNFKGTKCTRQFLGCNNGGGGVNFSKVNLKVISCEVNRNTETVIIRFLSGTGGILETQKLLSKAYLTHKSTYAYLPLFMGSWIMQEHWDLDLFWFGDGRICGGFPPVCVLSKVPRLAVFSIAPKNCVLESYLLSTSKIWQLWVPKSFNLKVLMECPTCIPLLHPNTLNYCTDKYIQRCTVTELTGRCVCTRRENGIRRWRILVPTESGGASGS